MAKRVKRFDPTNLPDELFVILEQDGDSSYTVSQPSIESLDDGAIVGVYRLERLGQITVTRELVDI